MISIVMAADKNYYYPLITTIASILENKNPDTEIEFCLFINQEYTQEDKDYIDRFLTSREVAPARYLDVSEAYADTKMNIEHITVATYYRLKILSSLPDLNKCLYLDVDTLVRVDLSDFYERSLDDAYIMGVLAAGYQVDEIGKQRKATTLGIPDMDSYVNAGVLVFNLARMRKDGLETRFERLLAENFPDQDQDILNAACYGGIKLLPPEYNAMTKYEFEDDFYTSDDAIPKCWSKWEWDKARTNPAIVHFADQDKPWTNFAVPFAKEWWHYAKVAGVAEDSFAHYFDVHASTEIKIRKLSIEKNRLYAQRDAALKDLGLAQKDSADLKIKLERLQEACEQSASELKAKTGTTKELETKLINAMQTQKAIFDELKQSHLQSDRLENQVGKYKKQIGESKSRILSLEKQLQKAKQRVADLEHSNSYRLGRALSAPFRWVKRKLKKAK